MVPKRALWRAVTWSTRQMSSHTAEPHGASTSAGHCPRVWAVQEAHVYRSQHSHHAQTGGGAQDNLDDFHGLGRVLLASRVTGQVGLAIPQNDG